jgi:hypothetical protein
MEKIKLSKKQKEVIEMLRGDFILKRHDSFGGAYWLAKNKGFHYLKNFDIRKATFDKLYWSGLIRQKRKDKYGHYYYCLTKFGKSIDMS